MPTVPQTAPIPLVIRRYNSGPLNFAAYSAGTTSATEDPDLRSSSDQRRRCRGRADRRVRAQQHPRRESRYVVRLPCDARGALPNRRQIIRPLGVQNNEDGNTRFSAWVRRACLSSAFPPGISGPAYSRYLSSISASACSPKPVKNPPGPPARCNCPAGTCASAPGPRPRSGSLVGHLPGLGDLAARATPRGLRRRPGGLGDGGAGAELVEFGPVGVGLLLGAPGAATQVSAKLGRCRVQVLGSVLWFLPWRLGRR